MNRIIDYRYCELISAAFALIPNGIVRRLNYIHFFTGSDPIFAGLINPDMAEKEKNAYRYTACCAFPYHQKVYDKHTTIILPHLLPPEYVVHELGHGLHEVIDFDHVAVPVTEYGGTNRWEAFAEAFTSWLIPGYGKRPDAATIVLFEILREVRP